MKKGNSHPFKYESGEKVKGSQTQRSLANICSVNTSTSHRSLYGFTTQLNSSSKISNNSLINTTAMSSTTNIMLSPTSHHAMTVQCSKINSPSSQCQLIQRNFTHLKPNTCYSQGDKLLIDSHLETNLNSSSTWLTFKDAFRQKDQRWQSPMAGNSIPFRLHTGTSIQQESTAQLFSPSKKRFPQLLEDLTSGIKKPVVSSRLLLHKDFTATTSTVPSNKQINLEPNQNESMKLINREVSPIIFNNREFQPTVTQVDGKSSQLKQIYYSELCLPQQNSLHVSYPRKRSQQQMLEQDIPVSLKKQRKSIYPARVFPTKLRSQEIIKENSCCQQSEVFDKELHTPKKQFITLPDRQSLSPPTSFAGGSENSQQKGQISSSRGKTINLATMNFQYRKHIKEQRDEQKKNRFGQELFGKFQAELKKMQRVRQNKQDVEYIYSYYNQSEELCQRTLFITEKCLSSHKRSRAPLEALLSAHSSVIEGYKQHINAQLFIQLEIAKIFIHIGSPFIAIPILKFVKRNAFLNLQDTYLMKAYRELSKCFIIIQKFEIAFGYAAKFLHLSWSCDSLSNELAAYDLLGKIFYYLGDSKKSSYYHQRMAMNIREPELSSLKIMQMENHRKIQKRRHEIYASREAKKARRKSEMLLDSSLCEVSSDEENNLNLLIPEENKNLQESERGANFTEEANSELDLQDYLPRHQQSLLGISIRRVPKFDIKSDKRFLEQTQVCANSDIRMEKRRRDNIQRFLLRPYEQLVHLKSVNGIGPMRDKMLVSHQSLNKSLMNFSHVSVFKKQMTPNVFLNGGKESSRGEKQCSTTLYSAGALAIETELDKKHNMEQSEYWSEYMVKGVDKQLRKIIKNIQFFIKKRDELKAVHVAKIKANNFFEPESTSYQSSSKEFLLQQLQNQKYQKQNSLFQEDI